MENSNERCENEEKTGTRAEIDNRWKSESLTRDSQFSIKGWGKETFQMFNLSWQRMESIMGYSNHFVSFYKLRVI